LKSPLWGKIVLIIALAVAFYFVMVLLSDVREVQNAFREFQWAYLLPVIALVLLNYFVRAERWHSYLNRINLALPRKKSYWLFLSGLSMSITPWKAGEALKALLLKIEKAAPLERGFALVFAERMSDLTGMILLIAIGSFAIAYGLLSFAIIVLLVAVIILIVSSERLSRRIVSWMKSKKRLQRFGALLQTVLKDARQLLTGRNLLQGTGYAAIAWAAECVAFFLILIGCGVEIGLLECIFIYAFSSVIGAISMLPGGMGTTEATMLGLLIALSVSASVASFAVILTRIFTLWFAVVIGLIFLVIYSRHCKNMGKGSLFGQPLAS